MKNILLILFLFIYSKSITQPKAIADTAIAVKLTSPHYLEKDSICIIDSITKKPTLINLISCNDCVIKYTIPKRPSSFVNDFEFILTKKENATLVKKLVEYEKKTSNEIMIVSLYNNWFLKENFTNLAISIAKYWGVGKVKKNNGILITLCVANKTIRMDLGLGIEKYISDEKAKSIIDEKMKPFFKKGNYFLGLKSGIDSIIQLIDVKK